MSASKTKTLDGIVDRPNRGSRGIRAVLDGVRDRGITRTMTGAVAFLACALPSLRATVPLTPSADGLTVYDSINNFTWLADFNLPATNRFGLPVCSGMSIDPKTCVNPSGSMSYQAATAWVAAMNTANYLGHGNWQVPTTPLIDNTGCSFTGTNGNSFGFNCAGGALGYLYYNALGLKAPNSAVSIPSYTLGPFSNFQPYYYWSGTSAAIGAQGYATFSFNTGFKDANTSPNYMYVLPMIQGKLPGTPTAASMGLQVNPGGQTVYDPQTNVTWLANADLAATNTFGLPLCTSQGTPKPCAGKDGAMDWDSASQFIANMNAYNSGAGYLGQKNWQLPPVDPACPNYRCVGSLNPMGNLFYNQLGFAAGTPIVAAPDIAVGAFHNIQPYIYWSCGGTSIQGACGTPPATSFQFSFSFGNGFLGTDILADDYYVTAYFAGQANPSSGPEITEVANAEGESPAIAPNTWVEIKGSNLAPAGDSRIWQSSDFVNGQMPTKLDGVSVTVNGKAAFVYYISPTQINILTPPDAMSGSVQVAVNNNGAAVSAAAQAQTLSPSFFVFSDGKHLAAVHADGSLLGPPSLSVPGYTFTPAKPGETVLIYANGFGATNVPLVAGSSVQYGTLTPTPTLTIGGVTATLSFAGLVSPGLFQFNVVIPLNAPGGDEPVTATYNGATTQAGTLLAMTGTAPPTSVTYYVAPNGNDSWSGTLASPNAAGKDGPFATLDHARAAVQTLNKAGLTQITVQVRTGTYYLPSTIQFTAADSGSPSLNITYQNYPGESPVISGGVRLTNWTNAGGNVWKTTLPASTQYFENLFYNGERRLRPRLGGYLGTYYRVADSVYLNSPAPPAAAPEANCSVYISGKGWECFDRFLYNPADPVTNAWKNLAPPTGNACGQPAGNSALTGDIELVIFEKFYVGRQRISCVDTTKHILYLTGPTVINAGIADAVGFIPQHRYVIENIEDQLTQPGQWFLDRSTTPWTLTYLAGTGENPNNDSVIMPQLEQILVASNLQYTTFQGLTIEHDNFTVPAVGFDSDDSQSTAAISFQNSQHITFDSDTVAHTSANGLDFISCINAQSNPSCVSRNTNAVTANNIVQNSAFYDVGISGIRIGTPGINGDSNANVPQFITVQNNVVEGFGRVFPAAKGIIQGDGHDNLYAHNDVYDGYHGAISICFCSGVPGLAPLTNNITVSFNHVYNLIQGIMNDGGSIYFRTSTTATNPPSSGTGNKMLNNRVHDVSDSSIQDSDGYGGDGLYIDDITGLVDVENNLVYRVSGSALDFSGSRAGPNQSSTIKNNIFAFARLSLISAADPYAQTAQFPAPIFFTASNNLFYFDRSSASSPSFYAQGGCVYDGGVAYTSFEQWTRNLYWRTDGGFANDPNAFHVLPNPVSPTNICFGDAAQAAWINYPFMGWQKLGEDVQSVVQDPGFKNPAYPADDFSLPNGSPGVGFVPFDPTQAGRTNPVINPPAVPATFPTKTFSPATDF